MEIQWQSTIMIASSFEDVYRYLVNFERHSEWSQTLEQVEPLRAGDETGVGAQYRTVERQAMQVNRKPGEALTDGQVITSLLNVRELTPFYRIAWRTQAIPRGATLDYIVSLASDGSSGTRLMMHVHFYPPRTTGFLSRFRSSSDQAILRGQYAAQWEAGLRNLKEVIESGVRLVASRPRSEPDLAPNVLKLDARVRGS